MTVRAFVLLFCLFVAPAVALAKALPPPLMLATVYEGEADVSEYWVSEKLDGVRGYWDGERLLTRGGYPVNPPDWFTLGWPKRPMDGELWMGRGRFAEVSGVVRTREPADAEWREVRFMVFDLPANEGPFEVRVFAIRRLLDTAHIPWLRPVRQFRIDDAADLDECLAEIVDHGGEGLMLHHRDAMHEIGRTDALLKYKPYRDAEARVIAHTEGEGKYEGMLGALLVERPDGLRFRIGTGFTDAERADPPPVGSRITYRYNGLTSNGVPRFVRFLRVRPRMPSGQPE